ncbi:MAG TPA: polyprenyl synthetase family protein [Candidatus Saccharimonadales bacterium]|nr:polyprenyl synthetase family protein [Candidatus Saccharimonadales bacterium]
MTDRDYFLAAYKDALEQLSAELPAVQRHIATTFPINDPLREEAVRFTAEGGKRFRPALSLIVASVYGKTDAFPHVALELFHKYLLVHDDIMDRDDARYGAPTVHAKMAELCLAPEDREHFGNSLGIMVGNLMAAASFGVIHHATLPLSTKDKLAKLLVRATNEVAWGWYDQFLMDYEPLDSPRLSFERIEKSIIWVTGKYSIKLPVHFGYAIAGVQPPKLEELFDTMGLLFQTGDDLVGLFGKVEDTGKSNYGDIIQGKKTLPLWLAYTNASPVDQKALRLHVGNKGCTATDIQEVRDIIVRSGGLERTQQLMQSYRDRCLEQVASIDMPADLRRFLRGFLYFLETRDR